jgi:hypothetical protein
MYQIITLVDGLMHKLSLDEKAPRAPDKLERLLQVKQKQKEEEAMHIEDTQRLVTEIEMLKVVLHLVVSRNRKDAYQFFMCLCIFSMSALNSKEFYKIFV